ncbi:hypothetical protein V4762_02190 [Thermodesulfobium sp. 4217-1]|uniref:hypothetical protein n=1 Tax=Thermodesulfobium sp. 4217-1 TaxID=3120013 RepID=UPI0032219C12
MDKQKKMKILLGVLIIILLLVAGIYVYPQLFQSNVNKPQVVQTPKPSVTNKEANVSNSIINPETLEKPKVQIGRSDPFIPLIGSEGNSSNAQGSSGSNTNFPMIKMNPFPTSLRLVGIMRVNDKMTAIIENGQQTYTVRSGDIILGNIRVVDVYLNSVVLTSSGQTKTYEL